MSRLQNCNHQIVEDYLEGLSYCSICGLVKEYKSYTTKSEGFSNIESTKESTERSGSPTNLIFNKNFLHDDFEIKNLSLSLKEKISYGKLKQWHRRITNSPTTEVEKISNKTYTLLSGIAFSIGLSRDLQKEVLELQEEL